MFSNILLSESYSANLLLLCQCTERTANNISFNNLSVDHGVRCVEIKQEKEGKASISAHEWSLMHETHLTKQQTT